MSNETLTAIAGMRVGHVTDADALTGCTVILCPQGTIGGVDQRGGAPGTRETDLLRPMHSVNEVNAIMLAGGSAYGLAAADGAMRYLEAQGVGYATGAGVVPIVPSAILYDLEVGRADVRPDAEMGYQACMNASDAPVDQGNVGAGTGCRVGAMRGNAFATKGGLGSAAITFANGLIVAALCAVNAVGDVLDEQGAILAGVRRIPDGNGFDGTLNIFRAMLEAPAQSSNTVIGVVATNARLTKEGANKVAQMAHNGLARAINPAHTMYDGDTIFSLATGEIDADLNVVGAFGAEVFAQAIRNGVRAAKTAGGVRSWDE